MKKEVKRTTNARSFSVELDSNGNLGEFGALIPGVVHTGAGEYPGILSPAPLLFLSSFSLSLKPVQWS